PPPPQSRRSTRAGMLRVPAAGWLRGGLAAHRRVVRTPEVTSRVRLADIAAAANVSVKTVSLALRGDQSVSRETPTRIQDLAFRLGYVSRGSKRQVIGVVVPYIGHRVYSDLFGLLRR